MIILLIGIALVSALMWHALWRNFWGACLGATVTGFALSMIIAVNYVGWWGDEFLAYAGGAIPTVFIVAAIVGMLLGRLRRSERREARAPSNPTIERDARKSGARPSL